MTINNTVEMIERTTARLFELSAEIPSVDTAWRDALLGEGDPTVLIKKLDALRTEQSVESARLEALQARQSEEQAASGDLVAQAASVQANELVASFEDAMQAVRAAGEEFVKAVAKLPDLNLLYGYASDSGSHINVIQTSTYYDGGPVTRAAALAGQRSGYAASTLGSVRNARSMHVAYRQK